MNSESYRRDDDSKEAEGKNEVATTSASEDKNTTCKNGVCELNWHPATRPQAA